MNVSRAVREQAAMGLDGGKSVTNECQLTFGPGGYWRIDGWIGIWKAEPAKLY